MSTFDVRGKEVAITRIAFAEGDYGSVDAIVKEGKHLEFICSPDGDYAHTKIQLSDIPNMIKALEKALELGWADAPKKTTKAAVKKKAKK